MNPNPQLDMNMQVTINLPLGVWNTVLGFVAKGSWDVADPVMQAIRQQISMQLQPQQLKDDDAAQVRQLHPVPDIAS